MHELDHILWEEWNLQAGEERFKDLTGVSPQRGGKHEDRGTHNSILALGEYCYLEIIAPDFDHALNTDLPVLPPDAFYPRLISFACQTDNLDLTTQLLHKSGLKTSEPFQVTRALTKESYLSWTTIITHGHDFGRFMPFFTQRNNPELLSESLAQVCKLESFVVGHPKYEELEEVYRIVGIDITVRSAEEGYLKAVLATPKGRVYLDSLTGVTRT